MNWRYKQYRKKYTHPWNNSHNPQHLHLELNNTCNSKCVFCYRQTDKWRTQFNSGTFMTLQDIEEVLTGAYEAGFRSVKFNWRGEPMLSPLIGYAVEVAHKLKYLDIMLNTNGSISIPKNVLKLATIISFSIDSAFPQTFDKNRVGLKLEKVLDNLKTASEEANGKIIVQRAVADNEPEKYDTWVKNIKVRLWKDNVEFVSKPLEERTADVNRLEPAAIKKRYCVEPARSVTVSVDKKVYACPYAYFEPGDLYLGNLQFNTMDQILKGDRRKDLIKVLKEGQLEHYPSCRNCPGKGCR